MIMTLQLIYAILSKLLRWRLHVEIEDLGT